jgi:OmpA-OmpF porin, OOP family
MRYTLLFIFINFYSFSQNNPLALVNSSYDEQNPVLSPDGKTLYLTIANHPQNTGGIKDPGDIWFSVWVGDRWSAPVHAGSLLNNRGYNGVAGISAGNSELFLLSHYTKNGDNPNTQGISVSQRTGTNWSTPQNISIPYFLNRSSMLTGQLDENLSVFVFSAESYNTLGAEDLYVCSKRSGQWTEPVNLGSKINTAFQEFSPSLSSDGRRLFFASNGRRGGLGSFDIYMAERLDESWTNWSLPVNLGPQINSDGRELFFRNHKDQLLALYTTTRNSDGYGDIRLYKDSLQTPIAIDTVIKIISAKRDTVVVDKQVTIKGRITNSKSGEPVAGKVIFRTDTLYSVSSNRQGVYLLIVPSTQVYSIEVEAKGYVNLSEKLDIHTYEMQTLEMNFKLQPIEVGAVVSLKSILFEIGTTNLLEESYDELNVVVDFLNSNPKVEIELEGHTDNRGDTKKNLVLSQQRVDKIKAYLVSKGISQKRIKGKGFGGSKPIATSDSEEARRLNRRVEFRILKN